MPIALRLSSCARSAARAIVVSAAMTAVGCARASAYDGAREATRDAGDGAIEATIDVVLTWHGVAYVCGHAGAGAPTLTDARFFVHEMRLIDAHGALTSASLVADGRFQTTDVALVDLAAATTGCRDGRVGHATLRVRASKVIPPLVLRARIGVPFAENHANPAVATGPLTVGEMSWGWQAGYKFLRLEGDRDGEPFRIHLGSTGCEGTFGHVTACARPNRAALEVHDFKLGSTVLALSLDALVDASSTGCMGDASPGCAAAFRGLGLDLDDGRSLGPAGAWHAR